MAHMKTAPEKLRRVPGSLRLGVRYALDTGKGFRV